MVLFQFSAGLAPVGGCHVGGGGEGLKKTVGREVLTGDFLRNKAWNESVEGKGKGHQIVKRKAQHKKATG